MSVDHGALSLGARLIPPRRPVSPDPGRAYRREDGATEDYARNSMQPELRRRRMVPELER
jgi:hypothetical protein